MDGYYNFVYYYIIFNIYRFTMQKNNKILIEKMLKSRTITITKKIFLIEYLSHKTTLVIQYIDDI